MRPLKPKSDFKWEPANFEAVQRAVEASRALGPGDRGNDPLITGIKQENGLHCPSPSHDAGSRYRVGIDREGVPEIQRQDDATGLWRPIPGAAP